MTRKTTPPSDAIRLAQDLATRLDAFNRATQAGELYVPAPLPKPPAGGAEAALVALFALSEPERALLATALAVSIEPALEDQVATLQGRPWRPIPTEALARALFGLEPGTIWRPTSGLAQWQLIAPVAEPSGAAPGFAIDPRIADWLSGKAALDEGLVGHCSLPQHGAPMPDWPLEPARASIAALMDEGAAPVRVDIAGPSGSGRTSHATALTNALGAAPILVEGAGFPEAETTALYARLQRFARLTGRVPVWQSQPARWPGHLPAVPLQILLTSGTEPVPSGKATRLELRQPMLTAAQRQNLWAELTGQNQPLPMSLASAGPGELHAMAPLARVKGAIAATVQDRARTALDAIGQVRTPQIGWEDLVLPASIIASLQGLVDETRTRAELMRDPEFRRLFARDAAPTALFSGPPGVGKTMAADCVAAELGLPLLVVDVSRIASRYIGETAKALSRTFAQAQRFGCILFFDEADATFSRRTEVKDAQDKHSNADTGHLLQLIEAYEGSVILSTNRRSDIDEAFLRRIRHMVDFPKPGKAERSHVWQKLARHLFPQAEVEAVLPELAICANRLDFTPAQIKAALLSARYAALHAANPLSYAMLLTGSQRELMKEGRNLPPDLMSELQTFQQAAEVRHVA